MRDWEKEKNDDGNRVFIYDYHSATPVGYKSDFVNELIEEIKKLRSLNTDIDRLKQENEKLKDMANKFTADYEVKLKKMERKMTRKWKEVRQ